MKRIKRESATNFLFSKDIAPCLTVKPGETFVIETEDASCGYFRSEDILPYPENCPPNYNPLSGPVYVEGAKPGDLLAINVEEVIPDTQSFTGFWPGEGPLADSLEWPELGKPFIHILPHLPGPSGTTRDGVAVFNEQVRWQLAPCIGTIGVAPAQETISSAEGQGPWGGNLDCRDIREGTRVYINCYNEGGLLSVGDVHASEGDTEFYASAAECRAEVVLSVDIIENKQIPFVRLEKPESIVSLYCFRPLETAVETAIIYLMRWLVDEYGMDSKDAYMYMSVNPEFRVNVYQMVQCGGLEYTVGAELPKKYIP